MPMTQRTYKWTLYIFTMTNEPYEKQVIPFNQDRIKYKSYIIMRFNIDIYGKISCTNNCTILKTYIS